MTTYEIEQRNTIMKQKKTLTEVIYLPEYEYSCIKKPCFRRSGNLHSGYGNRL